MFRAGSDGRKWRVRAELKAQLYGALEYMKASRHHPTNRELCGFLHWKLFKLHYVLRLLAAQGLISNVQKVGYHTGYQVRQLHPENLARIECHTPSTRECHTVKAFQKIHKERDVSELVAALIASAPENLPEEATPRGTPPVDGRKEQPQDQTQEGEWDYEDLRRSFFNRTSVALPFTFFRFLVDRIDSRGGKQIHYPRSYFTQAVYRLIRVERGSYEKAQADFAEREERRARYAPLFETPEVTQDHVRSFQTWRAMRGAA
jgi:hypothetical protein